MEGGHAAVALPSGLAAIAAALCAFVKAGDHLLVTDSVYAPTRTFCDERLKPNGVEIEYYDPLIGAGIEQLIRPNTRAVFCEAPGSLTFEMQDIPAIAAVAHARGIPVLADTTWGTPYFFRSFEQGVDVSIHAATKYIAGHSDVMMGIIVTNEQHWLTVRKTVADYGYGVSPDDCYLALRGFRTIGVRMKQQMANALKVARWLQSRPEVKRVIYPALESDPGPRDLEARFHRRGLAVLLRAEPAGEQAGRRVRERARALRHRLELGRLREPGPVVAPHRAIPHGDEVGPRRPDDTAAHRARGSGRSHRRSRARRSPP